MKKTKKTGKQNTNNKLTKITKTSITSIDDKIKKCEEELQSEFLLDNFKETNPNYNMLLRELPYEEHFVIENKRLSTLFDLAIALKDMNNKVFLQHVNEFKHDFGKWVKESFKNEKLANKMFKLKTKDQIHKEIINALHNELEMFKN